MTLPLFAVLLSQPVLVPASMRVVGFVLWLIASLVIILSMNRAYMFPRRRLWWTVARLLILIVLTYLVTSTSGGEHLIRSVIYEPYCEGWLYWTNALCWF